MNVVIFAGGSGTRLWPISRKKFPKQFQPIIDDKSTLELRVEQIAPMFGWNHIYFSTTESLVSLIKSMFPKIPTTNIITEPTRRDLGPAVGLAMSKLQKLGAGDEPVTVLWGDSVTQKPKNFLEILGVGEKLIRENPKQLIWLAEKPTFANENVGWVELGKRVGEENGVEYYRPAGFKYRPDLEMAQKWALTGKHSINTGYFITTANFILEKYEKSHPEMHAQLKKISATMGTNKETDTLQEIYPEMESIHFDHIVLDHIKEDQALVVQGELGWADPGTLYALKEFLQENKEANVTKGAVKTHKTTDSLIYNYIKKQTVTTIGLDGFIVVNTPDAILVCPKDQVGEIKELLAEFKGDEELEKLL
ncbi:MAG: mannose-1-phosphate guanylyltransferase [Candidatus Dojkabacteria bacterium]